MPSLNALAKEMDRDGLSLLLVDLGEDRRTVQRVVKARGYLAPVLLDASGAVMEAYGVRATPTVVLVGRDGTLRGRAIGPRPWTGAEGRALLRLLLAEPPPSR